MSEPGASVRRLPLAATVVGAATGEEHHHTKGLVRVTMACNERCPFCNVPEEDYAEPTPSEAEVQAQLDAFLTSGERTLTLSGGEPTLRRVTLLRTIERARAAGVPFVELQTNAILIDDRYAQDLAAAGLTSAFVSLLGDRAVDHDELAGLDGAFALCLRGIDALGDAGIAVTLNPVVARSTQSRVAAYVDFVAERLPRVQAISLSAVQPHGRAADNLELLPDYAILGPAIRQARERAAAQGIPLLNPYCGAPLCVGWSEARASSVEAIEAEARWSGEGRTGPSGVNNRGNKHQRGPCRGCAWRTRCGGAWHAYWEHRAGSGLSPPARRRAPWWPEAEALPDQESCRAAGPGRLGPATLAALRDMQRPTRWLLTDGLGPGDADRLLASGCTDLALWLPAAGATLDPELGEQLARLRDANAEVDDTFALDVTVGWRGVGRFATAMTALERAAALGVRAVELLVQPSDRHQRFVELARRQLGDGLEVRLGDEA